MDFSRGAFEAWKPFLRLVRTQKEVIQEKFRYERPWDNPVLNLALEVERAIQAGCTTDEAIFAFLNLAEEGEWLSEVQNMLGVAGGNVEWGNE